MGLDNRFRVEELTQSGSRGIFSENEEGEDTFIVPSPEGDRDGATYGYVHKPSYNNEELKRALDTEVDELFIRPENELPDVVPLSTFNRLQSDFTTASIEIISASIQIDQLESTGSRLGGASASLSLLYSQSQFELKGARDTVITQSMEITSQSLKIDKLHAYTGSVKTQVRNFETRFEVVTGSVDQALSRVNTLSQKTAGLESEVREAISNAQSDALLRLSEAVQTQIQTVESDVEQTRGEVEQTQGSVSSVLSRVRQLGGLLGQLAQQVFRR